MNIKVAAFTVSETSINMYLQSLCTAQWKTIFDSVKDFIAFQMYCYCKCYVDLPQGAVGWSAVCDCGIP